MEESLAMKCLSGYIAFYSINYSTATTAVADIHVTISVPNNQLLAIDSSNATASSWIRKNVAAFCPATRISAVSVGDEVLTTLPSVAPLLLPAQRALDDCLDLFDETVEELKTTVADLSQSTIGSKRYHDSQTLLSGAMTNLYTCLDGFAYSKGHVREKIEEGLLEISHLVSNSLAMLKKVPEKKKQSKNEIFPEYGKMKDGFPSWVTPKDRKLLQAPVNETTTSLWRLDSTRAAWRERSAGRRSGAAEELVVGDADGDMDVSHLTPLVCI
ncbi:hypothetical protein VIGAN_10104900 [Vigna angularis var. angularis]|uniref:Pectinesterase inhibitor domain-containing protein n=1 Tax=Vigna angularis var. angularis TaxID=157739 RepID=A0A0S3T2X9_PHAAN|nr:hypothetical protein VIGAN_10104900 [Vigna angularis var. angularis]